ncbi:hypothetical protein IF2G_00773 [Cordyceps javanica]|nr:hypothetical protein IF2G_00773 [Cordyceps javanica]
MRVAEVIAALLSQVHVSGLVRRWDASHHDLSPSGQVAGQIKVRDWASERSGMRHVAAPQRAVFARADLMYGRCR